MALQIGTPVSTIIGRCFRYAFKFAVVGAIIAGLAGFAYVLWQLHNFQPPSGSPVDDPTLTLISHTIFWAVIGASLGTVLGVGTGFVKKA